MPKAKLTNAFLNRVKLPKDKPKVDYFDTELTGLMLEVRKSSNMTFYYRYTKDSKTILHKLSSADTMTADEARRLALKIKKAIATDSLETMFLKKTKPITLNNFYHTHYLPHVKVNGNSWDKNQQVFTNHILPDLGTYSMNSITQTMIAKLHKDMVVIKELTHRGQTPFKE